MVVTASAWPTGECRHEEKCECVSGTPRVRSSGRLVKSEKNLVLQRRFFGFHGVGAAKRVCRKEGEGEGHPRFHSQAVWRNRTSLRFDHSARIFSTFGDLRSPNAGFSG